MKSAKALTRIEAMKADLWWQEAKAKENRKSSHVKYMKSLFKQNYPRSSNKLILNVR